MKTKNPSYFRHSKLSLDVINTLRYCQENLVGRVMINGVSLKTCGNRLRCFVNSTTCSCCGLEATHFAIERPFKSNDGLHLNLYGILDGKEVLFTHDHTLARCLGGEDKLHNCTTMCTICNSNKSKLEYQELQKRKNNVRKI